MQKGLLIPEQKVFVPQNFITILLLVYIFHQFLLLHEAFAFFSPSHIFPSAGFFCWGNSAI